MRLLKESVLGIWKARQASVRADLAQAQRTADAIQQKLDRLDEAFLFQRAIDIETYDRHAERLAKNSRRRGSRSTPRSSTNSTWKASWRSRSGFCPAPRISGCTATAPAFSYLREIRPAGDGGGGPDRDRRPLAEAAGLSRVPASRSGPPGRGQRDRDWLAEAAGLSGLPASRSGPPDRLKGGMVDQNIGGWSQVLIWLRNIDVLRTAA